METITKKKILTDEIAAQKRILGRFFTIRIMEELSLFVLHS